MGFMQKTQQTERLKSVGQAATQTSCELQGNPLHYKRLNPYHMTIHSFGICWGPNWCPYLQACFEAIRRTPLYKDASTQSKLNSTRKGKIAYSSKLQTSNKNSLRCSNTANVQSKIPMRERKVQ